MTILDKIIAQKKKEVALLKSSHSDKTLESSTYFDRKTISLKSSILEGTGIIAEFKRKSPSKGIINANASVEETTRGYARSGASGLSVLTDHEFFGGSNDDLQTARSVNTCPILRKDFVIDEYQIVEAKSIGADAILLIAAVLLAERCKSLAAFAHRLGLEVLLEVHDEDELKSNLGSGADLIGVNNRNLKTFEVTIDTSKQLSKLIPKDVVSVSESGISTPATILELREHGYRGFLIGENFMRQHDPARVAEAFINDLERRKQIVK